MRGDPQPHSHQGDGLNWTQGPAKDAQPGSRRSLGLRVKASSSFQQQDGLSLSELHVHEASLMCEHTENARILAPAL